MRNEQARARVRWRVVLNSLAFISGFSLVFVSLVHRRVFLAALFFGLSKRNQNFAADIHPACRPLFDGTL